MSSIITPKPDRNSAANSRPSTSGPGPRASGTSASGAGNMTAPATYAHPIPIRPASRRVISEPSTPPTAAAPRTSPSSPGRTCRDRVAYSTNRAANTKSKKLMTDAEMRAARTIGEPRMNRAPADSAPWPPLVGRRLPGLDPVQEERRAEEGQGVRGDRERRAQRLHEQAAQARAADEGEGAARVHQRRALHVLAGGHDGHRDRAVAGSEQGACHPRPERDAVQLGQREHVQCVADRDAGEQGRAADIGGDHENPAAAEPVSPGPGVHAEQQARQPDGGGEEAHLSGTRVQHEHGGERQRDRADLIPEHRDGLRAPVAPERPLAQQRGNQRGQPRAAGRRRFGRCFRFRGSAHRPGSSRSRAPERSPGKARCR